MSLSTSNRRGLLRNVFLELACISAQLWGQPAQPPMQAASRHEGTARIEGNVASDAGNLDLKGVQVQAYRIGAKNGQPVLVEACDTTTNNKGGYRCDNLVPGDYLLVAALTPEQSAASLPSFTIYPQTADIDRAVATHLGTADSQQLDIVVPPVKGSQIGGTVDGTAEHLEVGLSEQGELGYEYRVPVTASYKAGGRFSFRNIPDGRHVLTARWDRDQQEFTARTEVNVAGQDVDNLMLLGAPRSSIEIAVAPIDQPDTTVRKLHVENVITGEIINAEWDWDKHIFALEPVLPGEYEISVADPSNLCIHELSEGTGDITRPVQITGAQPLRKITMFVSARCSEIRGQVSSPERAQIVLSTESLTVLRATTSDATGKFSFAGLPVGDYRIFAWPAQANRAFRSLPYLRGFSDQSTSVNLDSSGSPTNVEVRVLP